VDKKLCDTCGRGNVSVCPAPVGEGDVVTFCPSYLRDPGVVCDNCSRRFNCSSDLRAVVDGATRCGHYEPFLF
jgi:hypothetical protein